MIGKFLKNMIKINIDIPYDDNLIYPTNTITKNAIIKYCINKNLDYEFLNCNDDMRVNIDGKCYEVIRAFMGRGGYGITCRPI